MTFFGHILHQDGVRQRPLLTLRGLTTGAKGHALARLFTTHQVSLMVVTPDASRCAQLVADLQWFLSDSPLPTAQWQGLTPPVCRYDNVVPHTLDRAQALQQRALQTYQPLWRLLGPDPVLVVTTVEALRYNVPPPALLAQSVCDVRVGAQLPLHDVAARLVAQGYTRVPLVENVGDFALRGGILDVYSPGHVQPVRIELFGDEIETIRTFDVQSQTSVATLRSTVLAPMLPSSRHATEQPAGFAPLHAYLQAQGWGDAAITASVEALRRQAPSAWPWGIDRFVSGALESPLAYLPETALLCCLDEEDVAVVLAHLPPPEPLQLGEQALPLPSEHYLSDTEVSRQLRERTDIVCTRYGAPPTSPTVVDLHLQGTPQFFGVIERFIAQMQQWQADAWCILILCHSAMEVQRFQALLATYQLTGQRVTGGTLCGPEEAFPPSTILLGVGEISQGYLWPAQRFGLLRHADVFGDKKHEAPAPPPPRQYPGHDFATLRPGDLVVHIDYGIGRYRGTTFLDVKDHKSGEFMELEYAEGAKLYVPSYRLSMVQRYTGSDSENGHIDRLGGAAWARTKERVRTALLAMAEDLVQLHATRKAVPGYGFSADTPLHHDFDAHFEYVETEDQLRAIQDVLTDMAQPHPMERLVCGDVGYGKTEVALRAAFRAVYDGKQVALLVPTTVLAQQHYETVQRRFAAHPVQVELLSRVQSRKDTQRVLDGLRLGTVDIVVGTHRLLQKDIQFKALGLLVVDEEHRFGVVHKEQIKRLSQHVDVLLLTATPIPRSLHMAMVGLRDCSIIATPPEGRSAIQTIVAPYSEDTIARAIRAELSREGQVFFVHNHIETLPAMQELLLRLVPESRVGIAHGQMSERALETMMLRFLQRDFDILLCTTIIESGLDIPTVNTIIIHHAESFGLAQLYQLRGRVGRSTRQAYAYLLIPGDLLLADTARKRIEALEEFSELGAGFHLASRDLEIRGAGNLLGPQQSGHIASIGFDLYCQMMEEAIRTRRGEEVPLRLEPELRLPVQGHIPATYVEHTLQRLALYRRLSTVTASAELIALRHEMQDRFGALPEPVLYLLEVMELKVMARQLLLERIEQRGTELLITFHPQTPVQPTRLLQWLHATSPNFRFHSERTVRIPMAQVTPAAQLAAIKNRLQRLQVGVSM